LDNAVGLEGKELPPGSGSAKQGATTFAMRGCAGCHGSTGTEGPAPALVGGVGTVAGPNPVRTVGSYWPFATSIWDFINRAMPLNQGGFLSADEVYALTAFLLYRNGIIQESDVMDAKSLPKVQMPNRNAFVLPPVSTWNPRMARPSKIEP
jgi:cytochrome c